YKWHKAVGAEHSTEIDWDHHAALNDVRDRAMADNVRWLLEKRYPGQKIILWTANTHAVKDAAAIDFAGFQGYRTMGSWLSDWFGPRYVALATTAYEGRIGNPPAAERDIGSAPPDSVEATCAHTSSGLSFTQLDGEARLGRFIGLHPFRAPWSRVFDAAI